MSMFYHNHFKRMRLSLLRNMKNRATIKAEFFHTVLNHIDIGISFRNDINECFVWINLIFTFVVSITTVCPKNYNRIFSSSITIKIVDWSNYALGMQKYNYLITSRRKPHSICFSSHGERGIFVTYFISPFPLSMPSFVCIYTYTIKMSIPCSMCNMSIPAVKTWMERTDDIPLVSKTLIPSWLLTESNRMEVFGKMQMISDGLVS